MSRIPIAKRPEEKPTKGTPVQVWANFLPITKFQYPQIQSYSLEITNQMRQQANKKDSEAVFLQMCREKKFGERASPAYDGNLVYSVTDLCNGSKSKRFDVCIVTVPAQDDVGRPKRFTAILKYSRPFDLKEMREYIKEKTDQPWDGTIQNILIVLNAFLNSKVRTQHLTLGRKAIFPKPDENRRRFLLGGVELLSGYWQSIRPGWNQLLINVDICHATYYPSGPMLEVIPKVLRLTPKDKEKSKDDLRCGLSRQEIEIISRFFKDVNVTTSYRGNNGIKPKHKVIQITFKSADEITINSQGKRISVTQQYRSEGVNLQYPMLPCVHAKKPKFGDIYLPLEICVVISASKPLDRFDRISWGNKTIYKHSTDEALRSIGMEVGSQFVQLQSRVLPAPKLISHEESEIIPQLGSWDSKRFIKGADLFNWSVVVFEDPKVLPRPQNVHTKQPNITYGNPQGDYAKSLAIAAQNARVNQNRPPQLIICAIQRKINGSSGIHPQIKKICGVDLGVVSQCVIAGNMKGDIVKWRQICGNIALKINGKLGGKNYSLAKNELKFKAEKRDKKGRPSVAAVCASVDATATTYISRYRMNKTLRNEIIETIDDMSIELLEEFKRRNGALPDQIIFYRDGVAEGQFEKVMNEEVELLKRAFVKFYSPKPPPKLTFIIVQKRHHARPVDPKNSGPNGSGNCLPGTVVDSGIVVPQYFSFYLQSHASPLGTARSTYYHVILNEGERPTVLNGDWQRVKPSIENTMYFV
ncbi:6244_t:CDS:10 [Dentiscutata heterogama]|uniref:6244_t:CDS:1 n=1 Tax=Dentiscutata heterogama TaxID=1316150 RepID=A0ACA9K0G4_9GLOM|nr:6244_t:CDS:10 [Dentiscutata heterogama]